MNKKTIVAVFLIIFISFPNVPYVYAVYDANKITKTQIGLKSSYQYSEQSKINSDTATLYTNNNDNKKNITVCVNAGHGTNGGTAVKTPCHPDGTAKVTDGTTAKGETEAYAVSTGMDFSNGTPEAEATLGVALKLKELLLEDGYNVLMIREDDDIQLDNVARTVIANNNADCHVSLHFDNTSGITGAYYIGVPEDEGYRKMEPVASHYEKSNELGVCLIGGLRSMGDIPINGEENLPQDLTQTSYSTIPSMDIELGNGHLEPGDALYQRLAEGVYTGIANFFNQNPNLANSSSSTNSTKKKKKNIFEEFFDAFFELLGGAVDIVRTVLGDLPQLLIDLIQTIPLGTWRDFKITYTYNELLSDGESGGKNRYTLVSEDATRRNPFIEIDGTEEEFSRDTEIPVIPADLYCFANGNVKLLNTNIFDKKEDRGILTNFVVVIVRVIIFLSAAFLIGMLIWHGINMVRSTITPKAKAGHMDGLKDFAKAVLMLIGSILIMAMSIYFMKLLFKTFQIEETDKLPIKVYVGANAKYSFQTSGIGYIRYMSELASHGLANLMLKILYTVVYIICVAVNLVTLIIMIVRYIILMYLTILGPIIGTASALHKKDVLGYTYQKWITSYLAWTSIQLILALAYRFILELCIPKG